MQAGSDEDLALWSSQPEDADLSDGHGDSAEQPDSVATGGQVSDEYPPASSHEVHFICQTILQPGCC